MVVNFFAVICLGIACQILFFIYGINHKAKSDRSFLILTLLAIAISLAYEMNIFSLSFGNNYPLFAKISLSLYISLNTLLIGSFTLNNIITFEDKTKYILVVKFIVAMLLSLCCILIFQNVFTEKSFTYDIQPISWIKNMDPHMHRIMVWNVGPLFKIMVFFWSVLVTIYGLLAVIRIAIRGFYNSVKDFFILGIFFIQCLFFFLFIKKSEVILLQATIFSYFSPILYYLLTYMMRPLFIKKSLRSKLYEESNDIFIIFNADDLLTDFNNSARIFFGFTKKNIYNLSLQNFIKDYVPLGNVPSDSFSVDQINVKNDRDDNIICQLDFHRIKYFDKFTTCSFFVIHDISEIFQNFAEIQQSSMTDRITGLLAQHVLAKKIREINIFRRFPYSAASCSIHVKKERKDLNENFALVKVAECIKSRIRGSDFASYENGNIVLLFPAEYNVAQNVMERIISAIEEDEYLKTDVSFQYGLTTRESPDEDIQQTINRAHAIMFKNKIESSIHGVTIDY